MKPTKYGYALIIALALLAGAIAKAKSVMDAQVAPEPIQKAETFGPWTPIIFSVYHTKYIGRTMRHGGRYDHKAMTCATNRYPKGTVLECEWKGRTVRVVVRDTMADWSSKTRVDLSGAAFRGLYPKYDMTNKTATLLEGARFRVVK